MTRETLDNVKLESFSIEEFSMSPSVDFKGLKVTGICSFKQLYNHSKAVVTLELKSGTDKDKTLYFVLAATFSDVDFDSITDTNTEGVSSLVPLFKMVLAGLTFSTARGLLYQLVKTTTGNAVFLPILRPEVLIQTEGFEFKC